MSIPRVVIGCIALLIVFGVYTALQRSGPANVVVILIDTLRADHMSYNGYERETTPILDAFAKENLNFTHAIAASNWTPPSISSIFTGVYPTVHGHMPLRSDGTHEQRTTKLDDNFVMLAEVFKQGGYVTAGISANPLIPERLGFAQGFDTYIDMNRVRAREVNDRTLEQLELLKKQSKPFFIYIHYIDPHDPYLPPKKYDIFQGPLKSREYPAKQVKLMARYDGEIRYVDKSVGEILDWMKSNGLYDDSIILITSDHGEQFKERGSQGHVDKLNSEETHVPFLLKAREQKGQITLPISHVDILPTLADLVNLPIPSYVQGVPLLKDFSAATRSGVLSEAVRHYNLKSFVRTDGKKIIASYPLADPLVRADKLDAQAEELYDTLEDPAELKPLDDTSLGDELRTGYQALYQEVRKPSSRFNSRSIGVDPSQLQNLKSLGYM